MVLMVHHGCVSDRFAWLVPAELWDVAEPLIEGPAVRWQGGGKARSDDEAVFAAIVFVLVTGCPWRKLPPVFGVSWQTVHRRYGQWTRAGLWRRLHRAVLDRLGEDGMLDWSRTVVDAASLRAKKGATTPGQTRSTGARAAANSTC
jgi:transposase